MTEEERIIRRWFEIGWNEPDESVVDELMHPEAVGHMAHGEERGPEPFKQVRAEFLSAFPDLQFEIEEVVTQAGCGAVRWRVRGTHTGEGFELRPSAQPIDVRGTTWMHIRDGQVVEGWDTWDMGSLMGSLQAASPEG